MVGVQWYKTALRNLEYWGCAWAGKSRVANPACFCFPQRASILTYTVTGTRASGLGTLPATSRPPADVLLLIDGSSTSATLRQSASTLFPAILSALANATSALRVGVAKFVDLPSTGTGALPYVLLLVLFGGFVWWP